MNSDVAVSVQAWCILGPILGMYGAGFFKACVGHGLAFTGCWPVRAAKFGQILTNFLARRPNLSCEPLQATLKLARAGLHIVIPDIVLPIFQFQIFILAMAMRA